MIMQTAQIKAKDVEVGMILLATGANFKMPGKVTRIDDKEGLRIYFGESYHSVSPDHQYTRKLPKVFKIISISNSGTKKSGFEVNDSHYTGHELETDNDFPTLQEMIGRLQELEYLNEKANKSNIRIEEDDNSLTLRERKTGYWLFEFRHEPKQS
jgi:ABC-type phosphate transport system auxiliary subunit